MPPCGPRLFVLFSCTVVCFVLFRPFHVLLSISFFFLGHLMRSRLEVARCVRLSEHGVHHIRTPRAYIFVCNVCCEERCLSAHIQQCCGCYWKSGSDRDTQKPAVVLCLCPVRCAMTADCVPVACLCLLLCAVMIWWGLLRCTRISNRSLAHTTRSLSENDLKLRE